MRACCRSCSIFCLYEYAAGVSAAVLVGCRSAADVLLVVHWLYNQTGDDIAPQPDGQIAAAGNGLACAARPLRA